jgi:hypothetical protein
LRHDFAQAGDDLLKSLAVAGGKPLVAPVRQDQPGIIAEEQHLEPGLLVERGDHPLERAEGALPLRGLALAGVALLEERGGLLDGLAEHGAGRADDEQHAFTFQLHAGEVLPSVHFRDGNRGLVNRGQRLLLVEQ